METVYESSAIHICLKKISWVSVLGLTPTGSSSHYNPSWAERWLGSSARATAACSPGRPTAPTTVWSAGWQAPKASYTHFISACYFIQSCRFQVTAVLVTGLCVWLFLPLLPVQQNKLHLGDKWWSWTEHMANIGKFKINSNINTDLGWHQTFKKYSRSFYFIYLCSPT